MAYVMPISCKDQKLLEVSQVAKHILRRDLPMRTLSIVAKALSDFWQCSPAGLIDALGRDGLTTGFTSTAMQQIWLHRNRAIPSADMLVMPSKMPSPDVLMTLAICLRMVRPPNMCFVPYQWLSALTACGRYWTELFTGLTPPYVQL